MAARRTKEAPQDKVMLAIGLLSEVETRFAARNAIISDLRKRRFQEHDVSIPVNYRSTTREVRLSLLADTIDLMSAIIDDAPWHPHVDPYDVGPTAERNSSLREKWSESAIKQAMLELNRPALTYSAANQMADGVGILKVIFRPDSWQTLPTAKSLFGRPVAEISEDQVSEYDRVVEKRKRGLRLPFSIVDVDPLSWYPVYGPDGELAAVIEVTERPVHQTVLQYADRVQLIGNEVVPINALGEPEPPRGLGQVDETRQTVQVWEYWDRTEMLTFIGQIPVKYSKHDMGEVPYFDAYARPSPDRDPARHSRPPLYKLMWIMDLLDSMWTMLSNASYLYSYPTPTITTAENAEVTLDAEGMPENVAWEPGKLMDLQKGQTFGFVTPPTQHLGLMSSMIDQALRMFEAGTGLGPAIRGLTGSDASGYQVNQMIQASMLSLHPAIKSRDLQIARMITYIWRLIERRIKADVWVWGTEPDNGVEKGKSKKWLKLGPSDIDGYYKCQVESKPMIDQMRMSRMAAGIQAYKAELLDPRTVIEEWFGYEDPDAILDAIAVHKELREGKLHDIMVEGALQKAHLIPPPKQPVPPGLDGQGGPGAGMGPQAPGIGMPLVPGEPTPQAPSQGQVQDMGGIGGRPAGSDRMPPHIQPQPLQAGP